MDVVAYHASLYPFVFPWISSDFITKISRAVPGDSWLIAASNRSSRSLERIQIAPWMHFCRWQKPALVCTNYSNSAKAFGDRVHRGVYEEGALPSWSLLDFQAVFPKVSSPDKIIWPMWVVSHLFLKNNERKKEQNWNVGCLFAEAAFCNLKVEMAKLFQKFLKILCFQMLQEWKWLPYEKGFGLSAQSDCLDKSSVSDFAMRFASERAGSSILCIPILAASCSALASGGVSGLQQSRLCTSKSVQPGLCGHHRAALRGM